jgi:hypothetical protein
VVPDQKAPAAVGNLLRRMESPKDPVAAEREPSRPPEGLRQSCLRRHRLIGVSRRPDPFILCLNRSPIPRHSRVYPSAGTISSADSFTNTIMLLDQRGRAFSSRRMSAGDPTPHTVEPWNGVERTLRWRHHSLDEGNMMILKRVLTVAALTRALPVVALAAALLVGLGPLDASAAPNPGHRDGAAAVDVDPQSRCGQKIPCGDECCVIA